MQFNFTHAALALACASLVAQTPGPPKAVTHKESSMPHHASGSFDVKLAPLIGEPGSDPVPGRMSIHKQFHGELEATSQGQMLMVGTEVKGSAGYVAMEKVSGTLQGRQGTFALQHSGTMKRGDAALSCTVVPDSGWGGLAGIDGKLQIDIVDKQHHYTFDYTLPA